MITLLVLLFLWACFGPLLFLAWDTVVSTAPYPGMRGFDWLMFAVSGPGLWIFGVGVFVRDTLWEVCRD